MPCIDEIGINLLIKNALSLMYNPEFNPISSMEIVALILDAIH